MAELFPHEPRAQKLKVVMLGGLSRKSGHLVVEFVMFELIMLVFIVVFVLLRNGEVCVGKEKLVKVEV